MTGAKHQIFVASPEIKQPEGTFDASQKSENQNEAHFEHFKPCDGFT